MQHRSAPNCDSKSVQTDPATDSIVVLVYLESHMAYQGSAAVAANPGAPPAVVPEAGSGTGSESRKPRMYS